MTANRVVLAGNGFDDARDAPDDRLVKHTPRNEVEDAGDQTAGDGNQDEHRPTQPCGHLVRAGEQLDRGLDPRQQGAGGRSTRHADDGCHHDQERMIVAHDGRELTTDDQAEALPDAIQASRHPAPDLVGDGRRTRIDVLEAACERGSLSAGAPPITNEVRPRQPVSDEGSSVTIGAYFVRLGSGTHRVECDREGGRARWVRNVPGRRTSPQSCPTRCLRLPAS